MNIRNENSYFWTVSNMLQRDQFCQESNLSSEKKRNARNYIHAKIDRVPVFRKKVSPGTGKVYKWFQFDNLSERSLQSAPRAAFPVDFDCGGDVFCSIGGQRKKKRKLVSASCKVCNAGRRFGAVTDQIKLPSVFQERKTEERGHSRHRFSRLPARYSAKLAR